MAKFRHKVLVEDIPYRILPALKNGTRPLDMDNAWEAANIIKVHVPQLAGVDDGTSGGCSGWLRFHKLGAYQLQGAFKEIEQVGLKHLLLSFAGSYYPRMIRGSTTVPSEHSFGTALDINAGWNGLNRPPAKKGTKGSVWELVPIFERWGFRWGGNFKRRDGMHFELARLIRDFHKAPPTPVKPAPVAVVGVAVAATVPVTLNGHTIKGAHLENGRLVAPVREFADALGLTLVAAQQGNSWVLTAKKA